MSNPETLLDVSDLKVHFPTADGGTVHAVDGVSFTIRNGVAYGIVGESGSGKTTVAQTCARLVEPTSGMIRLKGQDITAIKGDALRSIRKDIQFVFQDPYASLNPRERAGSIVRRPLDLMSIGSRSSRKARVDELFEIVGLHPEQQDLFPHQFSGGQRQRIGIARALASQPSLVICDEPVSALDVAIQAQILNLLARLKSEFGLSYLFISHDLAVVQHLCDVIAVMYLGTIVEVGTKRQIFQNPLHPYTRALISAVPSTSTVGRSERIRLEGEPPSPINLPTGCRFASRCSRSQPECLVSAPELQEVSDQHSVACRRVDADGNWV
ncbi:oligopeptide/dipeptide ABC transporter ATP-binding protein [Hoeflea sp. AS60]|uniref:ABC transporter ATP-binding protein n=1 Tax=Hoeflea sp. AS60 TaxID=3135780 RepID=UPI003179F936